MTVLEQWGLWGLEGLRLGFSCVSCAVQLELLEQDWLWSVEQ